jgi:LuxR family transcriptional regulator, maltose regulon positive regulatory protein
MSVTVLLRTKLHSPTVRHDLVSRQRLLDQLDIGLRSGVDFTRKLTLVSAPAGFGKTTLVAEWMAVSKSAIDPSPISWLSLDEADNDPARFLAYLIAAVQSLSPEVGLEAQVVLQAGALLALDDALTLLVNDIAAMAQPLILVLDDYHVIQTEAVDRLLAALLERQPPNFHLVIISRADPLLPLSRLRLRRQMLELRAHDLRFTETEVAAFLGQTMGLDLSAEAIAALEQRTEGWIAGLQLAALSVQGRDDVEDFIQAFSGSNHYIIDYLVDEVLKNQPPEVRDFLVQTSLLDRLCVGLCDAVWGRGATRPILDYLERVNLFLVPLDEQRKWYRYHHLFADSLQTGLDTVQSSLLHKRAARWYADNGLLPQAVRHALEAPDYEFAAELLGETGHEAALWAGAEFKRYCQWVELLPEETRQAHPRLQVMHARALQIVGELARAEHVLAKVEQLLQAMPDRNEELLALTAMYQAHCLLERGALPRALDLAQYAMSYLSTSTPLNHIRAAHCLAGIEYGLGKFNAATPRFTYVSQTAASQSLVMNAAECAARGLLLQGKLAVAQAMAERMIASVRSRTTYNHMAAGAFATLAEVCYYQNDLDCVTTHGEQAIELAQRMAPQALLRAHEIWVYLQFARLRQLRSDEEGALEALTHADRVACEIDNKFYLELAQMRHIAFQVGRERDVPSLLRVRTYLPVAFSYLEEYKAWVQVQLLIAQLHPQEALAILDKLVDVAKGDGRGLSVIELQLWRALTLHTLKHSTAAVAALTEAVTLAAPENCLRVFLDVGPALTGLLGRIRAVFPHFVDRLLLAFKEEGSRSKVESHAVSPPVPPSGQPAALNLKLESMSEREIEILHLVSEGLSNQEISLKLFIGVGTVKWYLTNLYDKLAVGNRTHAVARARELGIIS